MTWTERDLPQLQDRKIIVTGGNSGIGLEAARALARCGAEVTLACRDTTKAQHAAQKILGESPHAKVDVLALDLASLASVREFAARYADRHRQLHVLVNNAGVMAIPRAFPEDGFEMQFGVNHLGHFALTGRLLPQLLAAGDARVVNVSSNASRWAAMRWDELDGKKHYDKWTAYGRSKLSNLLFTFELARRIDDKQAALRSVACHPGYAATNLQHVGPAITDARLEAAAMWLGNTLLAQSARAGAWPTLLAATHESAHNGDYIGPKGLRELRGAPGHVRARRLAYNHEAMKKLWDLSVQLTGVDFAALA